MVKTAELQASASEGIFQRLYDFVMQKQDALAPLLIGMSTLLYFVFFPSRDALIFSAISFAGLALIVQFQRIGFIISLLLQAGFLAYAVAESSVLLFDQVLFSTCIAASSVIALLHTELVTPEVLSDEEKQVFGRIDAQVEKSRVIAESLHQMSARVEAVVLERQELVKKTEQLAAKLQTVSTEKEELWKTLYDTRQEMTGLYQNEKNLQAVNKLVVELQQEITRENNARLAFEQQCGSLQLRVEGLEKELLESRNETQITPLEIVTTDDEVSFSTDVDRVHSIYEGKYKQLRQQFEEKSEILDATRKQLFHTEQRVEVLQRQLAEPAEEVIRLSKEVSHLEQCFAQTDIVYRKEIEAYEQLVETLCKELADKDRDRS